jgi:hypothetical protein
VEKSPFVHFDACDVFVDVYPLVGGVRCVGVTRPVGDHRYLEAVPKHVHITSTGLAQKCRPLVAHVKHCKQERPDKGRCVVGFERFGLVLYPVRGLDPFLGSNFGDDSVDYPQHVIAGRYRGHPDVYGYLALLRRDVVA